MDFKPERDYLRETALYKQAQSNLTIMELNRILKRVYDIGYFEGRKEGEQMWEMPTELHLEIQNSLTVNTSPKKNVF